MYGTAGASVRRPSTPQAAREAVATPPWDAFVAAKTSDEFCRAWLALVCGQVRGAKAAAVLVESGDGHFMPISAWPEPAPEIGRLVGVVERAIGERSGVAQKNPDAEVRSMHIAYPVLVGTRVAGVVALEAECSDAEVQAALRSIHWGSAWLANLFSGRELDDAIQGRDRVGTVLEAIAVALRHGRFRHAVFEVANELRLRFGCARVAIGLVENEAVRVVALSDAATFEKRTPLVKGVASENGKNRTLSRLQRS